EQPTLARHPAAVAAKLAVRVHDAVARDHDGELVGAVGLRYCPERCRLAYALRQLPVRDRRAGRYAPQLVPHGALEVAAERLQRRVEGRAAPGEVLGELSLDAIYHRGAAWHDGCPGLKPPQLGLQASPLDELQEEQRLLVGYGEHGTQGAVEPRRAQRRGGGRAGRRADDAVEGGPETAVRLVTRVQLGVDHATSVADPLEGEAHASGPCELDERHAEPALELPASGGDVDAQLPEVTVAPAALRFALHGLHQPSYDLGDVVGMGERPAALARPVRGVQRLLGGAEELAVLEVRLPRRACRPAEDARGRDAYVEDTVVLGI